jgi:hypothetical protein
MKIPREMLVNALNEGQTYAKAGEKLGIHKDYCWKLAKDYGVKIIKTKRFE